MFLLFSHNDVTSNAPTRRHYHSPCLLTADKLGTWTSRFRPWPHHLGVSQNSVHRCVSRHRLCTDNSTTRDDASESGMHMTYRQWTQNPTWQQNFTKENARMGEDGTYFLSFHLFMHILTSFFACAFLFTNIFEQLSSISFCLRKC